MTTHNRQVPYRNTVPHGNLNSTDTKSYCEHESITLHDLKTGGGQNKTEKAAFAVCHWAGATQVMQKNKQSAHN